MRLKKFRLIIAGLMLAGIMLHEGNACAQDNATSTVRGKTYICYFTTQNGAENFEVTFSPIAYVSAMDGKGYGLYLTLNSFFAGYYLELNTLLWRGLRATAIQGDLLDRHDLLRLFTGIATGLTIQGTGFTWVDYKNPQPFVFFGYQHVAE